MRRQMDKEKEIRGQILSNAWNKYQAFDDGFSGKKEFKTHALIVIHDELHKRRRQTLEGILGDLSDGVLLKLMSDIREPTNEPRTPDDTRGANGGGIPIPTKRVRTKSNKRNKK